MLSFVAPYFLLCSYYSKMGIFGQPFCICSKKYTFLRSWAFYSNISRRSCYCAHSSKNSDFSISKPYINQHDSTPVSDKNHVICGFATRSCKLQFKLSTFDHGLYCTSFITSFDSIFGYLIFKLTIIS